MAVEKTINILHKKTLYYLLLLYPLLVKVVLGFLVKVKQLYIYINSFNLLVVVNFFKYNSITSFSSLLDIVVVDKPSRGLYRYELTYFFINYIFEYRFALKVLVDGVFPVFSISGLYNSSD